MVRRQEPPQKCVPSTQQKVGHSRETKGDNFCPSIFEREKAKRGSLCITITISGPSSALWIVVSWEHRHSCPSCALDWRPFHLVLNTHTPLCTDVALSIDGGICPASRTVIDHDVQPAPPSASAHQEHAHHTTDHASFPCHHHESVRDTMRINRIGCERAGHKRLSFGLGSCRRVQ